MTAPAPVDPVIARFAAIRETPAGLGPRWRWFPAGQLARARAYARLFGLAVCALHVQGVDPRGADPAGAAGYLAARQPPPAYWPPCWWAVVGAP